jgi:putative hydrolase of HD superfamily
MDDARLLRQLDFISELDQLKLILRRISLIGESRLENSAEHSWHLGVMASVLAEYAAEGADIGRATRMLLIHDVVEIDAGDTFCFDEQANLDKEERETRAADRLFGMLPGAQGSELRQLWDEFESGETPTARYANALDRLQGLLMNCGNQGGTWHEYGVSMEQILERMNPIREGAPALWPVALGLIEGAMAHDHVGTADPVPSTGGGTEIR